MPWKDWQFWLASVAALAALWFVLRPFLPARGSGDCGNCATKPRPRRAELTIGDTGGARDPGVTSEGSRERAPGPRAS
jgi:hypothetical protein